MGSIAEYSDSPTRDQDLQLEPDSPSGGRAEELDGLLRPVIDRLVAFLRSASTEPVGNQGHSSALANHLVDPHPPRELIDILSSTLTLPTSGRGKLGLLESLSAILQYSVNTSAQGFLDKLYASPSPPGIAADLILSILNTNLHVYQVSPVLTLIEKHVGKSLASIFSLNGPRAGGISTQGGSASTLTSVVAARHWLYPETKIEGNPDGGDLVLFTSAHAHYSVEKAAQVCGLGSNAVISVPVDEHGSMNSKELERLILIAKKGGKKPFYVCGTAGTTVLGSFDPFVEIGRIARKYGLWFHVDAAWGGSFIFSSKPELKDKLNGSETADSISWNPHKMLGMPVTCSFLLVNDLRRLWNANKMGAGYLFHGQDEDVESMLETNERLVVNGDAGLATTENNGKDWKEPYDLADLTMQCGRRGDSLKLFMAWQYYGSAGFARQVENAFAVAQHLAAQLENCDDIILVSRVPTPCLQVCFYFAPGKKLAFGDESGQIKAPNLNITAEKSRRCQILGKCNSMVTERMANALVPRGWMIDYAPALEGQPEAGKFFRVVVNIRTRRETVERLFHDIKETGDQVVRALQQRFGCVD